MVKDNLELLLPIWCKLVNHSLSAVSMEGVKTVDIRPTIKHLRLEKFKKSHRPISNLAFVGKFIERVVLKRLNDHMDINNR